MNKTILVALVCACALLSPPAAADYERGMRAYRGGDYAVAYRELEAAAQRDDPRAQYNLGSMLAFGTGIPANSTQAAYWYGRAARRGHVQAQYELGKMYAEGVGVRADPVQSYVWFSVAAAQGERRSIKNQAIMGRRLSDVQLDHADRIAEEHYERFVVPFQ